MPRKPDNGKGPKRPAWIPKRNLEAMAALDKAIDFAGGMGALAARIGTITGEEFKRQNVVNWARRGQVPPKMGVLLEKATGRMVTREQFNRDLYE